MIESSNRLVWMILSRKGIMMSVAPLLIVCFYGVVGSDWISPEKIGDSECKIKQEIQIGDYTYRCKFNEDEGLTFQIFCASEVIFSATKWSMGVNVLQVGEPLNISSNPQDAARDITHDGTPDLAIEVFSGGAHCCFGYYAFSLGKPFQKMVYMDDIDAQFEVKDMDGDKIYEYTGCDDTFAYWNSGFAGSPMPKVILRYEGDRLYLASDLMRQLVPDSDVIMEKVGEVRKEMEKFVNSPMRFDSGFPDFYSPLWGNMLDLIYSGWGDKAFEFLDLAWPKQKPEKDKFIAEFKKQLAKSHYWNELKIMNGWN